MYVVRPRGCTFPSSTDTRAAAEASNNNKKATQEDISRIIRSLKLRDERIYELDAELKKMTEEYRKLRDELSPVFQLAKERYVMRRRVVPRPT